MLVDEATVTWPDPILGMVAQVNKRGASERITQGIYEIGHFGSSHWLPNFEHWPQLPDKFDRISPLGCFGVCDNVEQIIARCPELVTSPRQFLITVHRVVRSEQEPDGGWRWHKWGDYIGVHSPTTEYLYDEPEIEQVLVFHIYEKKR